MPGITGFSHVELTVSDCERSAALLQEVLGVELINRHRGETFTVNAMVHPSGAVVDVMTHDGTNTSEGSDERRIGLDHLSFQVADRNELQECTTHLDAKGALRTIGYGPTLVLRDPDNIQLEFYVHPDHFEPRGNHERA
jgi:glyoxylase I family protein